MTASWSSAARYTLEALREQAAGMLALIRSCRSLPAARIRLYNLLTDYQFDSASDLEVALDERVIVRDCARAFRSVLREASDAKSGFSVAQALWDLAQGRPRPDLGPGFFANIIHLVQGVEGRASYRTPGDALLDASLEGREAALARSRELDALSARITALMARYPDGLAPEAVARRAGRRARVLAELGASELDWSRWRWQIRQIVRDPWTLRRLIRIGEGERAGVAAACEAGVPFAITPYTLSLIDDDPEAGRDRAIRVQVLPPLETAAVLGAAHGDARRAFDFMLERDTSPVDLVTRRYPSIAIFKPFNTCPQICVYCQRNWEIDDAMAPHALAAPETIEAACRFIEEHPAITECLVTGGDPLALGDRQLGALLGRLARIESLDLIRIGSRVPVTLPMRVTDELATLLGSLRVPGRRELCLVTHVEHPYEVTPELVAAVDRLRRQGIAVYNQHVYHFYVSRRFEAARLRLLLRRAGIDPYYTFLPKGKEETAAYRVPLSRLLQEQKEEARLLPGLRRTDEAVYNVPGLGKNYLRAYQHRDLISVLPDGARVYEFHPWEKMVSRRDAYVGTDVPILAYLERLHAIGEDPEAYSSIWYYF